MLECRSKAGRLHLRHRRFARQRSHSSSPDSQSSQHGHLQDRPIQRRIFQDPLAQPITNVHRPIASYYGFVEVFAGAAVVTKAMEERGWLTATPIELTLSPEFNVAYAHVMAWLSFIISDERVDSFMVEPVCTTFSILRRPALRDRFHPLGFNPKEPQTQMGNCLALRGLQCIHLGGRYYVPGVLKPPSAQKSGISHLGRRLRPRRASLKLEQIAVPMDPHTLSPFGFWAPVNFQATGSRCRCKQLGKKHIQVQGQYTKKSATYTPALAGALADDLTEAILAKRRANLDDGPRVDGLEDQLVNEVMKSSSWELVSSWPVKKDTHINLLEVEAVCKLCSKLAMQGGDVRAPIIVDSNVTKGSTNKGRSPSRAISSLLRRLGATLVCSGVSCVTPFAPTRHNTAHDPTRGVPIRPAIPGLDLEDWPEEDLFTLSEFSRLRRWASNWACLVIKLCGAECLRWRDRSKYRLPWGWKNLPLPFASFDQTLGFPGEGPQLLFLAILISAIFSKLGLSRFISNSPQWLPPRAFGFLYLFVLPLLDFRSHFPAAAMPITARNPADRQRAADRSGRLPLSMSRPVTTVTRNMREFLLESFHGWVSEENIPWTEMLEDYHHHLEEINSVLVAYGRLLHKHGRPYQHFAETINAVVSIKIGLKRNLQAAWSLAFSWIHDAGREA